MALACVFALLSNAGCAHAPITPESLTKRNVALVKSGAMFVAVRDIDGKGRNAWWGLEGELTPGEHTVTAVYLPLPAVFSTFVFKITAKPGRTYIIKGEANYGFKDRLLLRTPPLNKIWVVDSESNEKAGELIRSTGERVNKGDVVGLPKFFIWTIPQLDNRMALSRLDDGVTVDWDSKSGDSYFIAAWVYKLTKSTAAVEFRSQVEEMLQATFGDRGKDVEQSIEPYEGRRDVCVKFSDVSISKKNRAPGSGTGGSSIIPSGGGDPAAMLTTVVAVTATSILLAPRVLLERHGYSCRIPGNESFAIAFEYAHTSRSQDKDLAMPELAGKYFEQLEF